jgi:hypothetical protein
MMETFGSINISPLRAYDDDLLLYLINSRINSSGRITEQKPEPGPEWKGA